MSFPTLRLYKGERDSLKNSLNFVIGQNKIERNILWLDSVPVHQKPILIQLWRKCAPDPENPVHAIA